MIGIGVAGPLGRAVTPGEGEPAGASGPDDQERAAWVALVSVAGVGPVSFARLVGAFGSATGVLRRALDPDGPQALVRATADRERPWPTLQLDAAAAIAAAARTPVGERLDGLAQARVRAITIADVDYPARIRRIDLPPPVLFVRGGVAALDGRHAVAIVGTRRPTDEGRMTAARIAEAVGELGATVVSGLAYGIDAAAHAAAVRAGRPTVAVIGGGHGRLYPAAHRGLADAIAGEGGAVVSEFPPPVAPSRGTFPRRNRLISGLSDATVVVEAGRRSGALTTAAWALEQGRSLHLVPGRMDDPSVAGCLAFLRELAAEARIVAGIPELLEDLGLLGRGGAPPGGAVGATAVLASMGSTERAVAAAISPAGGTADELVAATGLAPATVLGILTVLELRGLVVDGFGRYRPTGALAAATGLGGQARVAPRASPGRPRDGAP